MELSTSDAIQIVSYTDSFFESNGLVIVVEVSFREKMYDIAYFDEGYEEYALYTLAPYFVGNFYNTTSELIAAVAEVTGSEEGAVEEINSACEWII